MHRTIVVVDVEGYGDPGRTNPHKVAVRDGLYEALQAAFAAAGVPWACCDHSDQGDAVFVLAPPEVPKAPFVETVPAALAAALREHNSAHPEQERIRVRMVVHAGEITYDSHGQASTAVNHAFRLLDAGPLKAALADSPGTLALIASSWFFDEVVRHSTVIDPATFRPAQVVVKETNTVGWIALADHPYPSDPALLKPAVGSRQTPKVVAPAPTPPVDEKLRLLAMASLNQWTAAANDRRLLHPTPLPIRWCRSTEPVAGPDSAAMYARFDPLPGLTAVSSSELIEGDKDTLHQIYGGLPSGRVLLIGPPGSGKSAAAILLLLDALRYRESAAPDDRAQIPVPVLFTLHGWDPDRGESASDWMVGKLAETYPMFHGRAGRQAAAELLAAGRVAGFLDGLDDIPAAVRPRVLEALADAPFRLVVLARTAEAVAAAHRRPLAGAVALALQPVKPTDAATYLLQPWVHPPPSPWQTLSDHLAEVADNRRPASALSDALTTPLALSLLRDVYGPTDPVDELTDTARFRAVADIDNHLLDQAVTTAYTPRPGHPTPRYTVATAQRTLRYLATRLAEQQTSDLAWWQIRTWTPHRYRVIAEAVTSLLLNVLIYGLALGLVFGRALGLLAGLVFGLAAGLSIGLSIGLASGLVGGALHGLTRHTEGAESTLGPADVWRYDRNAMLVALPGSVLGVGLLAVLTARLAPGLASALASRPSVVLTVGITVMLVVGLGAALIAKRVGTAATSPGAAAVHTALALVQLTIRHKIPLRLIAFLEDARSRHLLRTVGPVYQFRHATLQDRLTQPTPEDRSAS